jgi:hypothetical protein
VHALGSDGKVALLLHHLLTKLSTLGLLGLTSLPKSDRSEERLKVEVEIILADDKIPVEKIEELLLHKVDLDEVEAEAFKAFDSSVASPVLVLGRRVIERLGGEDESGKEDAVGSATHAFSDRRKTLLQTTEVDEGGHESGNLYRGSVDERLDELFDRRKSWFL